MMAKRSARMKQDHHTDTKKNIGVIAGHRKGSVLGSKRDV